MKKTLITIIMLLSSYVMADAYTGIAINNSNTTGTNQLMGKLYLNKDLGDGWGFSEQLKYYYNDNTFQQLKSFNAPTGAYFQDGILDSNSIITYNYGNGLFTTVGYRAYNYLDAGKFLDRQMFTNGFANKINEDLSQSTYLSLFRYSDNSYKILIENDAHYDIGHGFSFDTNLALYTINNKFAVEQTVTLDPLVQLNYNFTKATSIYISQELVHDLNSDKSTNITEIGFGTTW
jgi:hypothetical protein